MTKIVFCYVFLLRLLSKSESSSFSVHYYQQLLLSRCYNKQVASSTNSACYSQTLCNQQTSLVETRCQPSSSGGMFKLHWWVENSVIHNIFCSGMTSKVTKRVPACTIYFKIVFINNLDSIHNHTVYTQRPFHSENFAFNVVSQIIQLMLLPLTSVIEFFH